MNKKYDVFISSKSEDYGMAEKVYNFLTRNGLSVFLASKELQRIGEAQYALAIDDALDATMHMVVVSSSLSNITSKWVRYEWFTFSNDLKSGYRQGNLLTVLTGSLELKSLPPSLRHQQSFHYKNFQNILDYVGGNRLDNDFVLEYSTEVFNTLIQRGNYGDISQPFVLPVEDVFYIEGRGIVVTGKIESGKIHVGDNVAVMGLGKEKSTVCIGIEKHRKIWDEAQVGDEVGLLLRGLNKTDVFRGQVVSAPSCLSESNAFSCDCYFFAKDNNMNIDYKITSSHSLQFYFRTADFSGRVVLPQGIDFIRPDDFLPLKVVLSYSIPLNRGLVFEIFMDNRTIGVGIVKHVL